MPKKLIINEDYTVDGYDINLLRKSELCDIEQYHGNLLGNTYVRNNDYIRETMKSAFDKATVPVIESHRPITVSTYNVDLNSFNPYKEIKPKGFKEIARIYRNLQDRDPRYIVIYAVKNELFLIEHKRFLAFGEGTAIYHNTCDDNYIKRTTSFSDDGMLCLGQNALVLYTNMIDIIEDASLVSDDFANNNRSLKNKSIVIDVNDTVVFSRDKDSAFPNFDVIKKDNIGISYSNDKNYSTLIGPRTHYNRDNIENLTDKGFFLGDMDIYYSISLYESFNHSFLKGLMDKDIEYHKSIYDVLTSIRRDYTLNVSCRKFIDDYEYRFIKKAELRDGTQELKKLRIIFHYLKEKPISAGQKISGGYGDKTTVKDVLDGSPMLQYFIDEHGRKIDVVKPTSGVPNRTNTGQLTECITHDIYMMLHGLDEQKANRSKVEKSILGLLSFIDDALVESYVNEFKKNPDLWVEILKLKRLYLAVNPFNYKISIENYREFTEFIMSTYPEKYKTPEDLYLKVYRGNTYVGKAKLGILYICRAKQDADSKESVRAIDDEGADGNNKKTDKGQRASNNPVKASEKDKANQSTIFSREEMRVLEGKDKIKPMVSYQTALGVKLWR